MKEVGIWKRENGKIIIISRKIEEDGTVKEKITMDKDMDAKTKQKR